jgi:hypothetical protein
LPDESEDALASEDADSDLEGLVDEFLDLLV